MSDCFFWALEGAFLFGETISLRRNNINSFAYKNLLLQKLLPLKPSFHGVIFGPDPRNSQGRCGDVEEAERMEEDQTVTWFFRVQGEKPRKPFQSQFVFVNRRWWNQKQTARTTAATTKRTKRNQNPKSPNCLQGFGASVSFNKKGRLFSFWNEKENRHFRTRPAFWNFKIWGRKALENQLRRMDGCTTCTTTLVHVVMCD